MPVFMLSVPGLRASDIANMPQLARQLAGGTQHTLVPSFPCVTWPVQANMLTGCLPNEHGVVANGFYWRETRQVEMWTAWNDKILRPQIWDTLHEQSPPRSSAVWFPMLSKGCGADWIAMPAPIHNPDGSESLWCYTRPEALYGELRDALGHFPLRSFWGPFASIESSRWIIDSAIWASQRLRPDLFFVYLPHLDYAAQRNGPDSPQAVEATGTLDVELGRLFEAVNAARGTPPLWLIASEYVITPVDHVSYPNRLLREAGLLAVRNSESEGGAKAGEYLDFESSRAWALVDHQFSHVFVRDAVDVDRVVSLFANVPGIAQVLAGSRRAAYAMDHPRSGEVILISEPDSWQAYYWWLDDESAPGFARTVDIHRKPGYDPVELHWDSQTKTIPLDATLIRGSHGAPAVDSAQQGVLLASQPLDGVESVVRDIEIQQVLLRHFE